MNKLSIFLCVASFLSGCFLETIDVDTNNNKQTNEIVDDHTEENKMPPWSPETDDGDNNPCGEYQVIGKGTNIMFIPIPCNQFYFEKGRPIPIIVVE